MKRNIRITLIGVGVNIILFIMKLAGGLSSNSLALMSDSFNSFVVPGRERSERPRNP